MQVQKIIIADDHPLMRRALRGAIELASKEIGLSVQVDEASGGMDLVRRVCSSDPSVDHYSLAFTDFSMPDLNGIDAIAQIRMAGKTLPIYLISTHSSDAYSTIAARMGATGYIDKSGLNAEEEITAAIKAHLL